MACSNRFRPFVRSRVSFDAPARLALKPRPRPVFAKKKSPESGIDADFRVFLLIARTVALVITVYANYLLSVALNEKSWTDPFLTSKQQEGEIAFVFGSATERGSGAARRAMGFLTRWLAGKMEDPAKRQADFEKHMTTTVAKCEEM